MTEPISGFSCRWNEVTANSKVWIVDDDKSIRWVLERALIKEQLEPVTFENARDLLQRLGTDRPDVIISDIRMPGLDGLALLEEIKLRTPDVPVIIMTAFPDLDRAVSSFQGGAFEYLPKPFDIDELLSLVKRAVQRHPAGTGGNTGTRYGGPLKSSALPAPCRKYFARSAGCRVLNSPYW